MKKYRRAIALFLAIGLMVLIPSGMGVSASGNTVEAKMSENIAQVLSMTGIEREEYSDQQVIDVDGQRVRQLVFGRQFEGRHGWCKCKSNFPFYSMYE